MTTEVQIANLAKEVSRTKEALAAAKQRESLARSESCSAENQHSDAVKKFRAAVSEFCPEDKSKHFAVEEN